MVIKGFQWDSKEEDEMEGGNEAGSFVWEVFICSLALRQQHCSPCTSEKFLLCSSFGLN